MDSSELKEKEIFKAWEFRGAKLSFSDFELKFFLWQNKPLKSNIAACACPFPKQTSLKSNCIPLLLEQKQELYDFEFKFFETDRDRTSAENQTLLHVHVLFQDRSLKSNCIPQFL